MFYLKEYVIKYNFSLLLELQLKNKMTTSVKCAWKKKKRYVVGRETLW